MPSASRISSRQHPLVARCRALASRRDAPAVLLDGDHLLIDALAAGVTVSFVLAGPGAARDLLARADAAGADVHHVTDAVLDAASPVRRPSSLVAVAEWLPVPVETALDGSSDAGPCLALVSVQDPGNLGSAIRAADALGARGVLALDDCADPGGWKALRGAMGSTFRVPVARGRTDAAIAAARVRGLVIAATVPHDRAGGTHDPAALATASLVLLGNEGSGLPDHVVNQADARVAIPMRSGVESLNVAVTAALILDAVRRGANPQGAS